MSEVAFQGDCELLNASWSLDAGRTVEFRIAGQAYDRIHPFKRFQQKRGGRMGTRFAGVIAEIPSGQTRYEADVMLAAWGDSSSLGQHFKLWLDDDASQHPFAGCTRRKAAIPGEAFFIVLVEIGDDEHPVNQSGLGELPQQHRTDGQPSPDAAGHPASHPSSPGRPRPSATGGNGHGGSAGGTRKPPKLSSSAHLMVTGEMFLRYLKETKPAMAQWTAPLARRYAKTLAGIESMSDLDRDPAAVKRWREKVQHPFARWNHQDP